MGSVWVKTFRALRLNLSASARARVEQPHPGGPMIAMRSGNARLCDGLSGGSRDMSAAANTVASMDAHSVLAAAAVSASARPLLASSACPKPESPRAADELAGSCGEMYAHAALRSSAVTTDVAGGYSCATGDTPLTCWSMHRGLPIAGGYAYWYAATVRMRHKAARLTAACAASAVPATMRAASCLRHSSKGSNPAANLQCSACCAAAATSWPMTVAACSLRCAASAAACAARASAQHAACCAAAAACSAASVLPRASGPVGACKCT